MENGQGRTKTTSKRYFLKNDIDVVTSWPRDNCNLETSLPNTDPLHQVREEDSGRYSCRPSNTELAGTTVYVIRGELININGKNLEEFKQIFLQNYINYVKLFDPLLRPNFQSGCPFHIRSDYQSYDNI